MEDDYMSDTDSETPSEDANPKDEKEYTGKTALLPLEFLGNKELNPGDIISVKVMKVNDDQVEVCMASDKEEESQESEPQNSGASDSEDMMA